MISKERVREIVRDVLLEHMHGEWSDIAQDYVFSKWDKELLEINKAINTRIREEVCPVLSDEEVKQPCIEGACDFKCEVDG